MTPKKSFYTFLGILGLAILTTVAVFVLSQNSLAKRAESISDLKAENEFSDTQIQLYETAKAKVDELSFINDLAEEVLPDDKAQGETVGVLKKFANETGTEIQNIEFTAGGEVEDTNLTQTTVIEGLPGIRVSELNLTLKEGLSYEQFLRYLEKVENNRRKMQVIQVSITPNPEDRNLLSNALITIQIYLKG